MELAALLLIPTTTAAAVAALMRAIYTSRRSARYVYPVAIAAGFAAGCFLFPDRLPLVPERHWQWLPYVAIVAAIFGGVNAARGISLSDRFFLAPLLGIIAAWLIVPSYPDLKPDRPWSIVLLTTYLGLLSFLLALLPSHLRGRLFAVLLTLAALATAVLITAEISLRVGTVALRGPLAMFGCLLVPRRSKEGVDSFPREMLSFIPVFAVFAGGSAYIGAVSLPEPRWLLLAAPAAPCMLWLFAFGPLSRLQGVTKIVAQTAAVAVVPLAIVLWIFLQAKPDEWG